MYVIYGQETKGIEDAEQCVLIDVPDDLENEEVAEWLEENGDFGYGISHLVKFIQYPGCL